MNTLFQRYLFGSLRFINGLRRSFYQSSRYKIKRGYIHQSSIILHNDEGLTEQFQKEVYQKAGVFMEMYGWQSVTDIGCGSGYKLMKYLGGYKTIGVDLVHVVALPRKEYPHAKWVNANEFNIEKASTDLIICADVIEHVEYPDVFLKALFSAADWKCIMISTPERNLKRGWFHYGPSPNPGHWREWSMKEFFSFVSDYHKVETHEIINKEQATQLIICMRRSAIHE